MALQSGLVNNRFEKDLWDLVLPGDRETKLTCMRRSRAEPILQPFASTMLGSTSVFHDNLPHRRCASSRPRNSPGMQNRTSLDTQGYIQANPYRPWLLKWPGR